MNCPICLRKCEDKCTIKCLHSFCKDCIQAWCNITNACPLCKTKDIMSNCEICDHKTPYGVCQECQNILMSCNSNNLPKHKSKVKY